MDLATRMSQLGTETAFEVLARARALEQDGRDIIHLEIGEPDFDTPANIVEAGAQALKDGATHYTPSAGIDALREAISSDATARKGIAAAPENVIVTPGGKPIMFFIMMALLEEGDEVIYPDPGFPIYESMVTFLGGKRVPIGFSEVEGTMRWDVDSLLERIGPRTKLLIVNTPSNPVGCTVDASDLERIAAAAFEHDVFVLSDEIYSRILYSGEFTSIATYPGMADRTCVLDGFSKTYAMTGWRLGYGIMPSWLLPHISRLQTNSNSCTATFTQLAGVEALTGPQQSVDDMVSEFRRRRDLVVHGLNAMDGIHCANPDGAFYVFPNIESTGMRSKEAADFLLYEAGLALLSGTAFGRNGEGYLRLSYANSYENLERALEKMETALRTRSAPGVR